MDGRRVYESSRGGMSALEAHARVRARWLLGLVALCYGIATLGSRDVLTNPMREWHRAHAGSSFANLGLAGAVQFPLVFALIWLVDRTPLGGTRRRVWIIINALALAIFWFLFNPEGNGAVSSVVGLGAFLFLGNVLFAVAGGLAVDTGRGDAGTGPASAARHLGTSAAMLLAVFVRPLLQDRAALATSRLLAGAFLFLAIAVGLVRAESAATRASLSPSPSTFRSRGFWGCVLFLVWFGALEATSAAILHIHASGGPNPAAVQPPWLVPSLSLLCASAYLVLGRRLNAARLPTLCLGIGAVTTTLAVASRLLPLAVAETVRGVLVGFVWIPIIDLGMRFIRRDRAALGLWCLLAIPRLLTSPMAGLSIMFATRSPPATSMLEFVTVGLVVIGAGAWRLSQGAGLTRSIAEQSG